MEAPEELGGVLAARLEQNLSSSCVRTARVRNGNRIVNDGKLTWVLRNEFGDVVDVP